MNIIWVVRAWNLMKLEAVPGVYKTRNTIFAGGRCGSPSPHFQWFADVNFHCCRHCSMFQYPPFCMPYWLRSQVMIDWCGKNPKILSVRAICLCDSIYLCGLNMTLSPAFMFRKLTAEKLSLIVTYFVAVQFARTLLWRHAVNGE